MDIYYHIHDFMYVIYVCAHVCMCMCMERPAVSIGDFFLLLSTFFFEAGSLPEAGVHQISKASHLVSSRDPPNPASPEPLLQEHTP